jgi:hypothetical protein
VDTVATALLVDCHVTTLVMSDVPALLSVAVAVSCVGGPPTTRLALPVIVIAATVATATLKAPVFP